MSDGSPKLVAIDEEPNHQVVHALYLGNNWLQVFRRQKLLAAVLIHAAAGFASFAQSL